MLETSTDMLIESFAAALETTAFMVVEPPEPGPDGRPVIPAFTSAVVVTIALTGSITGALLLAAPRGLGALIASNILALDPASPQAAERAEDALQETLNVTTGLYLARRCGLGGVTPEMGMPVISVLPDAEAWGRLAERPGAAIVMADGFPLLVHVSEAA